MIKGELSASEDLTLYGQMEGSVTLPNHTLTIGPHADIKAAHRRKIGRHHGRRYRQRHSRRKNRDSEYRVHKRRRGVAAPVAIAWGLRDASGARSRCPNRVSRQRPAV